MQKKILGAAVRLIPINRDGRWQDQSLLVPQDVAEFCTATAQLYDKLGFEEPWIGYIGALDGDAIGGAAFVGPPKNNRVEIAYFTEASRRNQGIAAAMARQIVAIAKQRVPTLDIFAKTMPETNPSTNILTKLGFRLVGTEQDHEIGTAWAWVLTGSEF